MPHEKMQKAQDIERRTSVRPPTSPRFKRLRREVQAPEKLKELVFSGLSFRALLVFAAIIGVIAFLV